MKEPTVKMVVKFVEFIFFRYAPQKKPTVEQITNAWYDFLRDKP